MRMLRKGLSRHSPHVCLVSILLSSNTSVVGERHTVRLSPSLQVLEATRRCPCYPAPAPASHPAGESRCEYYPNTRTRRGMPL